MNSSGQAGFLVMVGGYIKVAARSILKNKLISAINIVGLSIGMAVSMILVLWVWDEVSINHDYVDHDKIGRVFQNVLKNGEVVTWKVVPVPLAEELRKNYSSDFDYVAHVTVLQEDLVGIDNIVFTKHGRYVEPDFFKLFSIKLIRGKIDQLNGTGTIYLSASTAKSYFGDANPLDKTMSLTGSQTGPVNVVVAGVYEDFPQQSYFGGTDFIAPWDIMMTVPAIKEMEDPWRQNFVELYVRVKDFTSFPSASSKIKDARLVNVNEEVAKMKPELFLHPMDMWYLYSEFKNGKNSGGRIQYVWLFSAIGIFILVMACINFMNLTTAQSERRAKEVGVRKSIGSFRSQLIIRFFTESFLITLFSFFIALFLILAALPWFGTLAGKPITIPFADPFFWIISFISCCIVALVCGSYPAIYLSSITAIEALKGLYRSAKSAALLRRILVVLQFSIAVILIVVTITVSQQIRFAMDRPVGYDRNALICVPVKTDAIHRHIDAFREKVTKDDRVASVAEADDMPTVRSYLTTGISWQGKDPSIISGFAAFSVSKEYGETVGWKIKHGRDFYQESFSDTSSIIINEAAMKSMGFIDPIGQELQWWDSNYRIVGVIENMIHESPYQAMQPSVYTLLTDPGFLIIRLNSKADLEKTLTQIEAAYKEFNPDEPFNYQFVEDEFRKKFDAEEHVKKLTSIFSTLAVFISCLGLFGLVAYIADQRTKEIGVRKVLGASVINIWILLSKDFVSLVLISCVIAVPFGYYAISSWLENYDYRITFTWTIFAQATLSVLIVTLLTSSYQTIVAALRNPVKSLRAD